MIIFMIFIKSSSKQVLRGRRILGAIYQMGKLSPGALSDLTKAAGKSGTESGQGSKPLWPWDQDPVQLGWVRGVPGGL